MGECFHSQSGTNLAFNILLHVFILFLFLSLLFKVFISQIETNTFQNEIEDLIDTNMNKTLNAYLLKDPIFKQKIKTNQTFLSTLDQMYSQPDPITSINNTWVMNLNLAIIILIGISIFIVLGFLYFSCKKCMNLKDILLENLIIFSAIGSIEYLFFTQIAFKYIPVPPSLLIKTVYDTVKQNLTEK